MGAAKTRAKNRHAPLQALHERFVEVGEEAQHAVHRRRGRDGIGRVDDDLAFEDLGARQVQRGFGGITFDREHDQLTEARRLGERARRGVGARLALPFRKFARFTRAAHDLVTVLQESIREHLPDRSRPQHRDALHAASVG